MSFESKFARFMRNTGPARFFVPLGVILVVFGIILLVFKTDHYLETTGKVTSVGAYGVPDEEEEQEYLVSVNYTVDSKSYSSEYIVQGPCKAGESIKVYYDPQDPASSTNAKSNMILPVIMICGGALSLIGGILLTVKSFKKSKALDSTAGAFPSAAFGNFKDAPDVTEYYFRFDGHSLKPGYIIEDAERRVLFEGKMVKNALVGARHFEFVNHVAGRTTPHEVGHTLTTSYNNDAFSANSWFKIDGKNIWDFLHHQGIRLNTNMHSKFPYMIYEAAKNGAPFACIETASIYVHEDDEAQHKAKVPTGNMFYRFWTNSDDFDLLFLTIFAISETEQLVKE